MCAAIHVRLLQLVCVPAPSPCASRFISTTFEGRVSLGYAKPALMNPVEFAVMPPVLRVAVAGPVWIESAKPASPERSRAPYVRFRPNWARAVLRPACTPTTLPFAPEPALIPVDIAPLSLAFRLARPLRPPVTAASAPASARERNATRWQPTAEVLSKPKAAIVPPTPGFVVCQHVASAIPRIRASVAAPTAASSGVWHNSVKILLLSGATTAPHPQGLVACPPRTIAFRPAGSPRTTSLAALAGSWVTADQAPATGSFRFQLDPVALRSARHVAMKAPEPTTALVHRGPTAVTLVWKNQVRLGPQTRVSPMRPRFQVPLRTSLRLVEPKPSARLFSTLAAFWRAVPRWSCQAGVVVLLAVAGWVAVGRVSKSGEVQNAQKDLILRLRQRAAVELQDDFRSGLSQWTGAAGWANSWTYDVTGFARPGRLALLAGSVRLTDYRLEFLAQIDKRAVSWVFRASDARNYYACKLVEAKRDTGTAYSIVRYAVIGGRERLRVQLPLPVTTTAKTMFRVRQEIRGDQFTTYLDEREIDTWSDSSLARGGFGFFADPGEAAYIRWVNVAYQDDSLGRLCAYLVSGKHN